MLFLQKVYNQVLLNCLGCVEHYCTRIIKFEANVPIYTILLWDNARSWPFFFKQIRGSTVKRNPRIMVFNEYWSNTDSCNGLVLYFKKNVLTFTIQFYNNLSILSHKWLYNFKINKVKYLQFSLTVIHKRCA